MFKPLIINEKNTNYLISDKGEIKNNKTNKILKGTIRNGYLAVKLTIENKKKDFMVHRLVAMSFLENPLNLPQVNHKDKNKLNNSIDNLEWISAQDNMIHRSQSLSSSQRARKKNKQDIVLDEHWRQFYNSNYWINDLGLCYNNKTKCLLTPVKNGKYLKYCLSIDGIKYSYLAHKMVYMLFKDDYDSNKQINHIDGNTMNNALSNLELVTNSENMRHSYYTLGNNLIKIGQYDLDNNLIKIYNSMSDAARENNCSVSAISSVCNGRAKTHKNFIWKKIIV